MWGLETLSETEGPLENLVQPLHTTDKVTNSQEEGVIHSRSWRGQAPAQNLLDPHPSLSELDCPRHLCTYTCLVREPRLVFMNSSPHSKYCFSYLKRYRLKKKVLKFQQNLASILGMIFMHCKTCFTLFVFPFNLSPLLNFYLWYFQVQLSCVIFPSWAWPPPSQTPTQLTFRKRMMGPKPLTINNYICTFVKCSWDFSFPSDKFLYNTGVRERSNTWVIG